MFWIKNLRYYLINSKIGFNLSRYFVGEIFSRKKKIYSATYDKDVSDCFNRPANIPRVGVIVKNEYFPWTYKSENTIKYVSFLEKNNIPYKKIVVAKNSWLNDIGDVDLLIWDINSNFMSLYEAQTKIYIIEKILKKYCYPSFNDVWSYEDKIRQCLLYRIWNIPHPNTFISFDRQDALDSLNSIPLPVISKVNWSSASIGVSMLKTKSSVERHIYKVFGSGKKTFTTYLKQKNYILFQEFIKGAKYDLRIIVIGEKIFGYYRFSKKNDFRASGSGIYKKTHLPEKAMLEAIRIKEMMTSKVLAIDFISPDDSSFYVVETSIFFRIDTPEQLKIDNDPGYYQHDNGTFTFHKGKFWIQDLLLNEIINEWSSDILNIPMLNDNAIY